MALSHGGLKAPYLIFWGLGIRSSFADKPADLVRENSFSILLSTPNPKFLPQSRSAQYFSLESGRIKHSPNGLFLQKEMPVLEP